MYLDDTLRAGLEALKARDGIPASEAVRRALTEYLRAQGIAIRPPRPPKKTKKTKRSSR